MNNEYLNMYGYNNHGIYQHWLANVTFVQPSLEHYQYKENELSVALEHNSKDMYINCIHNF